MWYVRAEPEAMTVRHAHAARPHWILTLGDQVKRFAITLCGAVGGLLLTWFYLYTYSHISWPKLPSTPARGCYEIDKCPVSWWQGALFFAYLLGPAVFFGVVNATAYRRWSCKRWSATLGIGTLLAGLFYLEPYVSRLLAL